MSEWEDGLLWFEREVREKILTSDFRKNMENRIISDYMEKKKTCYIGREKINAYWAKTG